MILVGSGLEQELDVGCEHPSRQPYEAQLLICMLARRRTAVHGEAAHGRLLATLQRGEQMWSRLGWAKGLFPSYSTRSPVGKGATPKATSWGEQPISRTLGLEGPGVWLSHLIQTSDSGWRCSPLETPPAEILPSFQPPEKRVRIKEKEVGFSFSGLQTWAPPCQWILGCNRFTQVPRDSMVPSIARCKAPEFQGIASLAFQVGLHLLRSPVLPKSIPPPSTSRRSARNCVSCLHPP